MIERVTAIQFDRLAGNGRTQPGFILAENSNGQEVELILKLSDKCDRGVTSLAIELLCACLAGDLGLPVPKPYIVELELEWIASISDAGWATSARQSGSAAFGSKRVPAGFGPWVTGTNISDSLASRVAGILLFDAVTDNPDRRPDNPNCLQRGEEVRIIDHELCFHPLILGWQPPWQIGSLQHLATTGKHIFRDALRGRDIDWTPIIAAWERLSDTTISDYGSFIPEEWSDALPFVEGALGKIKDARDHITECAIEVQRALKC